MSQTRVKLSLLFILLIASDAKSELDAGQLVVSGLGVLTSLSNPLEFAKSLFELGNVIGSSIEEDTIQGTLDKVSDKLDEISRDLESFKQEVMSKLEKIEILIETKPLLNELFLLAREVEDFYRDLGQILHDKPSQIFIDSFINSAASYSPGGIIRNLNRMNNILYKVDNIAHKYSTKYELIATPICPIRYSQVKIIQKLYLALFNAEVRGLIVLAYAFRHMIKNESKKDIEKNLNFVKTNFLTRSKEAFEAQKKDMGMISRDLWNCEAESRNAGNKTEIDLFNDEMSFMQITRSVVESTILNRSICNSPNENVISRYFWDCPSIDHDEPNTNYAEFGPFIYRTYEVKGYTSRANGQACYFLKNVESLCRNHDTASTCNEYAYCRGRIRDCESLESNVAVCYSAQFSKRPNLNYAELDGRIIGGSRPPCPGKVYNHRYMEAIAVMYNPHASCACTCENPEAKVYISMREARSDVDDNMVITGIRFKKIKQVLHLEIQQAKLLPGAGIDPRTRAWKNVKGFGVEDAGIHLRADYLALSYDHRSFELDEIEVAKGTVLISVKFALHEGLFRLQVQGAPFDPKSGKLAGNRFSWHGHKTPRNQMTHFELKELDLPSEHEIGQPFIASKNQYMALTTSSLEKHLGQSVVPFVDLSSIEASNPDVALSGVGLFHKSYKKDAAGFLALKILTYNFNN